MEEPQVQLLMRQMLEAIAYLHQKDICHRDVKPHNYMLRCRLRLLDIKGSELTPQFRAPTPPSRKLLKRYSSQTAKNGGLDLSWLISAFLGRPDFQSRGP